MPGPRVLNNNNKLFMPMMMLLPAFARGTGRSLVRCFCHGTSSGFRDLTNIKRTIIPSFHYPLTFIFETVAIKLQVDPNFSYGRFLKGAKQAVIVVSQKISDGKIDELEDLVAPGAIEEIRENLPYWTSDQRKKIITCEDEILFSAPYRTFFRKDDNGLYRLEVDILMQYIPGYRFSKALVAFEDFKDNTIVVNFSFLRFYRDQKPATDWQIRKLNYFSEMDEIKRRLMG